MARKRDFGNDRARQVLAQEAARIIAEQGIEDFGPDHRHEPRSGSG
jgi:hypothetical protein